MLGFRLKKKSRIDSDVLFYIFIIVYTVVFFLTSFHQYACRVWQ